MKTLTITLEGGPYLIRREGVTPQEARNFVTSYALLMQAREDAANAPAVRRLARLEAELVPTPRSGGQGTSGPEKHEVDTAPAAPADVVQGDAAAAVKPADSPAVPVPKARILTNHLPNGDICGWWKLDGEDRYCPRRHRTPGAMHQWTMPPPPV